MHYCHIILCLFFFLLYTSSCCFILPKLVVQNFWKDFILSESHRVYLLTKNPDYIIFISSAWHTIIYVGAV